MGRHLESDSVKNGRAAERYGDTIILDMNRASRDTDISLKSLGLKYGFSRERARQLFRQINGFSYSSIKLNRRNIHKSHLDANRVDPNRRRKKCLGDSNPHKGSRAEETFFNQCRSLGLNIVPIFSKVDFLVNNRMVEFKSSSSCSIPYKTSGKRYYHFGHITSNEYKNLEFLICMIIPRKEYYVIPKHEIGTLSGILIPDTSCKNLCPRRKPSRYMQYKNAWHLLG